MAVRIREARQADLAEIVRIERASFGDPWSESTFHAILTRPNAELLVAEEDDGPPCGYAATWWVEDQGELGNVAVAEEARGRGVGVALLDAAFSKLRDRGVRECFLEVRESNEAARRLYERLGFSVVGRRRSYYRKPTEDALVMRLGWGALRSENQARLM